MVDLRLTPFEHFMLLDDQPGWPMTFWLRLRFEGQLDATRLEQSLTAVAQNYPLLRSTVQTDRRGSPVWKVREACATLTLLSTFEDEDRVPAETPLDIRQQPGFRTWVSQDQQGGQLWFEFHHAACDAIGALGFLEGVFRHYEGQGDAQLVGLEPHLTSLIDRERCGAAAGLGSLLQQWGWMGYRAACYLITRPASLQGLTNVADSAAHGGAPVRSEIRSIDLGPLEAFRGVAARSGATINDLILRDILCALDDVFADMQPALRPRLRVMIPMNLRDQAGQGVGINMCGMVHLDSTAPRSGSRDELLRGISAAMRRNRRHRLGRTNLAVLKAVTVAGRLESLRASRRCLATTVLTNLGIPWLSLCDNHGRLNVGDAQVWELEIVPPVRFGTPCTMGLATYAGQLRLSLHYQPSAMSRDAVKLLCIRLAHHCERTLHPEVAMARGNGCPS